MKPKHNLYLKITFDRSTYWNDVNMGEMLDKLDLSQFEEQFKLKTKPTLSNVAKIIKRKVIKAQLML